MQRRLDLAVCEGWDLAKRYKGLQLARRMSGSSEQQEFFEAEQQAILEECDFRRTGDGEQSDEHVDRLVNEHGA